MKVRCASERLEFVPCANCGHAVEAHAERKGSQPLRVCRRCDCIDYKPGAASPHQWARHRMPGNSALLLSPRAAEADPHAE